jgi:PPM family protein phosphatase
MDCWGQTDIGRARPSNEDQFMIADVCKSMRIHQTSLGLEHQTRLFGNTQGKLILVADGMGGHAAGERASQLVLDTIVDYILNHLIWFLQQDSESEHDFIEQLKEGLVSCQTRINQETVAIPQRAGMGSTLTLAYIVWPRLFLIHVGDSRCYLLRNGGLQQLTSDHTLAALATTADKVAVSSPDTNRASLTSSRLTTNVLWNVIGGGKSVPHPDALAFDLQIGDTLLLCTDGLTNSVAADQVRKILEGKVATSSVCQQLIDAANAEGGQDNITVAVSRFLDRMPEETLVQEIEESVVSTKLADTVDYSPGSTTKIDGQKEVQTMEGSLSLSGET